VAGIGRPRGEGNVEWDLRSSVKGEQRKW
jgi:hypothetical protein